MFIKSILIASRVYGCFKTIKDKPSGLLPFPILKLNWRKGTSHRDDTADTQGLDEKPSAEIC